MQHQYKILIPNLEIDHCHQFKYPTDYNQDIKVMQYEVHDHFGDIRGKTKEAQLHLAAIMVSFSRKQNFNGVTMDECAAKLIRSCYGNRPLKSPELEKLMNIVKLSIHYNLSHILLICDTLLQIASHLESILPFKIEKNTIKNDVLLAQRDYMQYGNSIPLNSLELEVHNLKRP